MDTFTAIIEKIIAVLTVLQQIFGSLSKKDKS